MYPNSEGNILTCIFSLQAQQKPTFNHFCMYFGQGHFFTSVIGSISGQLIFLTGSGPSPSNAIAGLQINQNTFQPNKKLIVIVIITIVYIFIALITAIAAAIVLVLITIVIIWLAP